MNTARIQKSAEFLSDIMKQKHGPNEEKSWEQRQPPFSHSQIFHAFRKDHSDGRTLGRQTEAQERDAGFMQDRMGKHEHQARDKLRNKIRCHMGKRDVKFPFSKLFRDLHILTLLQL